MEAKKNLGITWYSRLPSRRYYSPAPFQMRHEKLKRLTRIYLVFIYYGFDFDLIFTVIKKNVISLTTLIGIIQVNT